MLLAKRKGYTDREKCPELGLAELVVTYLTFEGLKVALSAREIGP